MIKVYLEEREKAKAQEKSPTSLAYAAALRGAVG